MSSPSVDATPTVVPQVALPAGWYPDPIGRSPLRYWSGQAWTRWVWDGTSVNRDQLPARRPLGLDDLSHLAFVEQVFLPEVCSTGALTPQQLNRMWELVDTLAIRAGQPNGVPTAAAVTCPATVRADAAAVMPQGPAAPLRPASAPLQRSRPTVAWTSVTPVEVARVPQTAKIVQPPSALSRWWTRTRDSVGSDLAVHWLAYLGVLLFFVGAFGLVAFAFADVAPTMRWVAEIVIAAAPFLSAALLLSRGADAVGRALEVGGGLLLPVMVITSFLDGVAVPPDLDGTAMVATFTACSALIAVGYALWSRRHPSSGLRFLVAPMVWLTVGMATLGLDREIPVGKAVATPASAQFAAVAASLVVTLVLARWRPRSPLAAPTLTAGVTGTLVIGLLAVLTWAAEDWPPVAIAVTGVLILAAVELLRSRLLAPVANVAEPLWWAVVGCALVPGLGPGPAAAVAAAGFVLLLEAAGTARRPAWAVALPAAGALVSAAAVRADPWWAVGVLTAATGWAMARRLVPFDVPRAAIALDLTAGILPLTLVVALAVATDVPAAVACGAGLVLLATVPATRPVLHRDEHDRFWKFWWPAALVIAAIATATGWADASSASQHWVVTMSVVALAIAAGVGPVPVVWRVWPVVGLGTCAWLMACTTAGATEVVRGAALGVAALALVVAAHARQQPGSDLATVPPVRAGVGLAGHVLALIALAAGGLGWGLVAGVTLATTGWAVTTAFDSRDRSPVGGALARIGQPLRYLPPALVAIGVPVTVALTLDLAAWLRMDSAWASMVLAVTAMCYALASRLHLPERIAATLAWGAFAAGIGACITPQTRPAAVGWAALILAVLLLPANRRVWPQVWVAWAALAPLVGLVAIDVSPWFAAQPVTSAVAITLVGVGGPLLIGGAATDLRFGGWLPHYLPRRRSLWPAVVLGALELSAGLLLALLAVPTRTAGWVSAVAAIVLLVTGVLARVGFLGGVAAVLGWWTLLLVVGTDSETLPLIGVLVVAVVLAAAEALHRVVPGGTWWSRWDAPLLLAAAPVALTALAFSGGSGIFAATSMLLGVECWAVALRLHAIAWALATLGVTGTCLVLGGAAAASSGWLALALLVVSTGLTVVAVRTSGRRSRWFQLGGAVAAVAAWLATVDWMDWTAQQSVDITAVGAGLVALAASGLALIGSVERSWVLVWGATAVVLVAGCAALAEQGYLSGDAISPPLAVVVGLMLVAAALLLGAAPLAIGWLRDLGVLAAFGAAVLSFQSFDADAAVQVAVLTLASVGCAFATFALTNHPAGRVWRRAVMELGVGAVAVATVVAVRQLPDVAFLVLCLATAAVQAATIGVVFRVLLVQCMSPLFACGAWLIYASALLNGNPQWSTVPIGLAVLVVVGLWRHDRVLHDGDVAATEIVGLEFVGIGFLVGSSFAQALTENVAYALLALTFGLIIAEWGMTSEVRRRLISGVAVVLAALLVLVGVPLVHLLPGWGSAGLWVLVLGLGLVTVVAATTLEKSRAAVHKDLVRFEQATSDWE